MSSTIKLGTTIERTSKFVNNAPLLYTNSGELAFSIGDDVRQFMLAPPFAWRWNRAYATPTVLIAGEQDYQLTISDFGWLEKATITYPPPPGQPNAAVITKEIEITQSLSVETRLGEPGFISPILDDNNGNITFRLQMVPDAAYTLNLVYQKAAPSFGAVTDSWAPIPDYYSYLYNLGFLAKTYEYKGDERFAFTQQEFLKQVVAANDGLEDSDKNIFLGPYANYQRQLEGSRQTGALARQGRIG